MTAVHDSWVQGTLTDHGEPLHQTTFVVLDLETTGGSAARDHITEIGAVKVRGGEVLGEFHTLVNPGIRIPAFIVSLTGITDVMVERAPTLETVFPALLEFLGSAVLVAHNARFDVGFLKAAAQRLEYPWPGNQVVDTVLMARRATTKEEAPNKKLSTLARVFGASTSPNHRALDDARATVDVFHGLLERLAHLGVTHRGDLVTLRNPIPERIRQKSHLADGLPDRAGVYVFADAQGTPLYVGTSRQLRTRVKSYFTNAEQRAHVREMVSLTQHVTYRVYPTVVEAQVRELLAISSLRPRFNKASTRPERSLWITLSNEPHPRLLLRRSVAPPDPWALGPIPGSRAARAIIEAMQDWSGTRSCTTRLPRRPGSAARSCLLKDLGRCAAPCVEEDSAYPAAVENARRALADPSPVMDHLQALLESAAVAEEFERAATARDTLTALIQGSIRRARRHSLAGMVAVAAAPSNGAWDMIAVKHGALIGSRHVRERPWHAAIDLRERALAAPSRDVTQQELDVVWDWLTAPGVRLMYVDGTWSSPIHSMERMQWWMERDRRLVRTRHEARAVAD